MTKTKRHQIGIFPAVLLGLVSLTACEETSLETLDQDLTPEEASELALVQDDAARMAALELSETTNDVAADFGSPVAEARRLAAQAGFRLAAADAALHAGDRRRALDEAREARRLLARAIVAHGGATAVEALIERVEELAAQIDAEDDDVFDDPAAVRAKLERLAAEARAFLASGELVRAAERALLAEQIARHHRGRRHVRGDVVPERARLAVALAGTAVQLAERLIGAEEAPVRDVGAGDVSDVDDQRNRWLEHAKRMLARAQEALAAGHFARAVHFAEHAHGSALKAVILPGGVTEEEIRALVALAHHLHDEAKIAIGDDPTPLELRLFERAGRLIELGEQMIADGHRRGVAPVWRGAVISRWLMD
jgi:HEPN domain-containing protein